MSKVNYKAMAFNTDIAGCRHVHHDSEEVPRRPNDPKTQELPLYLLVQPSLLPIYVDDLCSNMLTAMYQVQPALHWWLVQRHCNRRHSGLTSFHVQIR